MINKLYVKIKKNIQENYKEYLLYIIIFVIATIHIPYYIYTGGGTINLKDRIELDGEINGSYNLAYVKQMRATIPTYLLSYIISTWDLESIDDIKIDKDENINDLQIRDKLYLEEANNNAIINAYRLANKKIEIKSANYKVIYIHKDSDTNIQVGDTLISVNGVLIKNNKEYKEYLKTKNIGEKLDIKVNRDGKEITCYAYLKEIEKEKIIGLYLVNVYDYEVEPEISLKFNKNESGPSGGFMLSLAIYDRLVDTDLSKGRKIVGTGTIDESGNVGEIGGVKYKLMGAEKEGADIFFVPKENYDEAIKIKKQYHYKTEVISVETLQEAIEFLEK